MGLQIAGSGAPGPLAAAPAPRAGPVYSDVSNLVFSVTGASAKFTNATLTISDVSPAVSFFASVPIWHGGNVLAAPSCVCGLDQSFPS